MAAHRVSRAGIQNNPVFFMSEEALFPKVQAGFQIQMDLEENLFLILRRFYLNQMRKESVSI